MVWQTTLGSLPQSWKLDCGTDTTVPIIPMSGPIIHLILLLLLCLVWSEACWEEPGISLGWTWLLSDKGCDQREEAGKNLEYVSGVYLAAIWCWLNSLWPDGHQTMMPDPERNMPDSRHRSVTPDVSDMSDMSDSICPRHFRHTSNCWWSELWLGLGRDWAQSWHNAKTLQYVLQQMLQWALQC